MILEQSFYALPEFLVGTGFVKYESEGTLVMAYAMAALQELNGRGVNNPIKELRGEVGYPDVADRSADIHLNYRNFGLLSAELTTYGVRDDNWLEAKFFRKNTGGGATLPKLHSSYALLRDLIRICVFPPEQSLGQTPAPASASRYLLHVYEGRPADHLAFLRNSKAKGGRSTRGWLENLHVAGQHKLLADDYSKEPSKTFNSCVGTSLSDLSLEMNVTTLAIAPIGSKYSLYLTRVDGFKLTRQQITIAVSNGQCTESATGDWQKLRTQIASQLAK